MRIVLVGGNSFIANHVRLEALAQGLDVIGLHHGADLDLAQADVVVNFATDQALFRETYSEERDWDVRVAAAAAKAHSHFVMCSTRRVYPAPVRLGAVETDPATGDETVYGANKAKSEKTVTQIVGANGTIFRLSNIFGFEYSETGQRRSFFAQLLGSLRRNGEIRFDMSAATRRDFLPVEVCASAIVRGLRGGVGGVFNLGCGFPVICGDVAQWVVEGFGSGRLVIEPDVVKDEFYLDMQNWRATFGPLIGEDALQNYCMELGRRLRRA